MKFVDHHMCLEEMSVLLIHFKLTKISYIKNLFKILLHVSCLFKFIQWYLLCGYF